MRFDVFSAGNFSLWGNLFRSVPIKNGVKKLKVTWNPSLDEDLRNYHIMMQPIRTSEDEI